SKLPLALIDLLKRRATNAVDQVLHVIEYGVFIDLLPVLVITFGTICIDMLMHESRKSVARGPLVLVKRERELQRQFEYFEFLLRADHVDDRFAEFGGQD